MEYNIVADETKRLFAAVKVSEPLPVGDMWSLKTGTYGIDKMQVPTEYSQIVEWCRFFYTHDGLAYTTINKYVELGINGYALNPGTCSKNELKVYEYLNDKVETWLRNAALEFMVSGLVIPEVTWDAVNPKEISTLLRKRYVLPTDLWFRDPLSIELRKSPLPNRLTTLVTVSEEDIFFILNNGVYSDGVEDREAFKELKEQYPDFVDQVKAGKIRFKLKDVMILRRYVRSGNVYPTPYLLPALELFMHKRNLRKMDYAIASRVIAAIMLIRLGSDEFPLTEDDDDLVEELKAQMNWRGISGNQERIFQLFANHTLQIDWIMPDVEALLDEGKYRNVNDDILVALGLPRIIVSGETLRSGSSNAEMALLPPANSIEAMRKQLLEFPKKLYAEIRERNNFKGIPEPYYPPIRLMNIKDLVEMGTKLYEIGVVSKTGVGEMATVDHDTELQRMVFETEKRKDLGLPERPEVPFSNPPGSSTPQTNRRDDGKEKD